MLSAQERIAQYSNRDLEAIRVRLDIQRKIQRDKFLDNHSSSKPVIKSILEIVTNGESVVEKVSAADLQAYFRASRALHSLEILDVLAMRMNQEFNKRLLVGIRR